MRYMFNVRSVPAPQPLVRPSLCAPLVPPPPHALPLPPAPRLASQPSLGPAARVGVQPAAELRHLQRHGHELDV
eukprot:scaffold44333_cov59-Phaeocystis_antarctica.AAC.1